jgi:hypothetical protein
MNGEQRREDRLDAWYDGSAICVIAVGSHGDPLDLADHEVEAFVVKLQECLRASREQTPSVQVLPPDVAAWVSAHFPGEVAERARRALEAAVDHTGTPVGERLLRCLAVGSRGHLDALLRLVSEVRTDFRDVIVAGEYESVDQKLVRVRDLTKPIEE